MDPFLLLDRAREHQLGETAVRVLLRISQGVKSQTAITRESTFSRAAIGQAVKTLATRELVCKTRDLTNETKVILTLTQTGRDMVATLTAPEVKTETLKS